LEFQAKSEDRLARIPFFAELFDYIMFAFKDLMSYILKNWREMGKL